VGVSEFDIIERYFQRQLRRADVVRGIGDDAAVLEVPSGHQLVVSVDTLVAGRHFPQRSHAYDIGYKSLAVNLSDLAAMGAEPAWATLSLTLPEADPGWLQSFADGFFDLAARFGVELVGGDTTRGALSITVQVQGFVETGRAMRRDSARPGQALFVTGTPGDAACALAQIEAGARADPYLLERLNRPHPRVAFGRALAATGAAAIDVSDGLLADLGHLLDASGCGATLRPDRIPRSPALSAAGGERALVWQLCGGDDYELCFAVNAEQTGRVAALARAEALPIAEIGVIERAAGLRCVLEDGSSYQPPCSGYDHFADERAD
jgi:thiamine-monophosphate kinase